MKKASFVVGKDYQNNKIFNLEDKNLNRDNCLLPFFLLREGFKKSGYDLITQDLLPPQSADIVIYNEMPKPFPIEIERDKSYLLIFESELIRKDNWDLDKHKHFKKIFTWNDDFVNNKKYIKFNFPNTLVVTEPGLSERKKLLTLISGNKSCLHSKELYSERLKTIKWFEKNHPDDFHYYGMGWDYPFNVWFQKVFRKLKVLNFFPKVKSKCYQGKVEQKLPTLRKYKFAICYENAKEINGYITEKIFDCFFAGCIPVYWGPGNIEKFIPANCFIDRRVFKSHEDMYNYLIKMTDLEIQNYQNNINNFLKSDAAKYFSDEAFVTTIIKNITNE